MITITPGIGEAGKTTVYIRARNPAIDTTPPNQYNRWVAISSRCAHLGCPVRWVPAAERFICPCHGGVYDLQGVRVGGPPPRPLDRFYTRLNEKTGLVEVGPRYSVNSELRIFSPRDPGEPLDGIGQYLYPSRPTRARVLMPKLPLPPIPPRFLPQPPPPGTQARPAAHAAREGRRGRQDRRRLGRRAHVAVGRRALAAVPQGPEGDQLVLHARLGDDVRLPLAGRDRRLPGDVLPPRRAGDAYESVRYITNSVFLGQFVRGMHKWGSSVMVILVFLHMARTFFFGAYKYPRELNWVIGVVLLILTMMMSFTGYLLPFDQRSYWATIVGVNINGSGPAARPVPQRLPARRARVHGDDAVALLRDPHAARARARSSR